MLFKKLFPFWILFLLPVSGMTMLTAYAGNMRHESMGQYLDSSIITAKVKAALLADEIVKSLPIAVTTYQDTVQLSGFVDSLYQKERARIIAEKVEGVGEVDNALRIKIHHPYSHN